MTSFLLAPIGAKQQPGNLSQAIDLYLIARQQLENGLGLTVPTRLGTTVQDALRRHRITTVSPSTDQPAVPRR